jgi:hypothetical protein
MGCEVRLGDFTAKAYPATSGEINILYVMGLLAMRIARRADSIGRRNAANLSHRRC